MTTRIMVQEMLVFYVSLFVISIYLFKYLLFISLKRQIITDMMNKTNF